MTQTWLDVSEIVAGLVLSGKLPATYIDTQYLIAPFDTMVDKIKSNGSSPNLSHLIEVVGLQPIQSATSAADAVKEMADADWIGILKNTYIRQEVGTFFEKVGRKLVKGMDVDIPKVVEMTTKLAVNKGTVNRMSDVVASPVKFIKTGWRAIDLHLGGIPEQGLITVAAPPKTGKTSFIMKLASCFSKMHPDKEVIIFTIEMIDTEFKARALEIDPELSEDVMKRIHLCDNVSDVFDMGNKASSINNLGLIAIDFADLMIDGEVDSGKMENIYRTLTKIAKNLKVPIVLLAQLSSSYQGGVPRPNSIRWTRLAEALSWMLLMLYAPARDYFAEKDKLLTPVPGKSYIVCWLSRGGFRLHPGPGAIMLDWTGKTGWGNGKGRWFSFGNEIQDDNEND